MTSNGYEDDFDVVDDDSSWNQYESYAMRRGPQQTAVHMTQQMTTKVVRHTMEGPASLPVKMQLMTAVTLQN